MDVGLIALRLAHIIAGAAWVGGAFLMLTIVNRTAKLSGADGEKFMERLLTIGKGAEYFAILALTTVVAGGLLYWRASGGLNLTWITSPTGLGFTIGALAAIVSFVWGGAVVAPTVKKMQAIGADIVAAGGQPTHDQLSRLDVLRRRLEVFGRADLLLLGIAVVMMATARYL